MGISRKGRKRMYKGSVNKLVPSDQVQYYLDNGWQFGMPPGVGSTGRKNMHNPATGKQLQVPVDRVAEYQAKGWVLGLPKGRTQNAVWVKKDGVEQKVSTSDLNLYLAQGWTKGRVKTTAGRVWMHKGDEYRMVLADQVSSYQADGFEVGGQATTANRRWVNKDGELKLVNRDEVAHYVNSGWRVGYGLRWVHNDTECRRVSANQIAEYTCRGWRTGLPAGFVPVMKGDEERHIPQADLAAWEAEGWQRASTSGVQSPEEGDFTVYKLTSTEGKVYIGMTKNLSRRLAEHRSLAESEGPATSSIIKALKRLGFDSFSQEVLVTDLTYDEACEQEAAWIAYFDSANPDKGYNESFGGMGKGVRYNDIFRFNCSQQIKNSEKFQAAMRDPAYLAKLSKAASGRRAIHKGEERKLVRPEELDVYLSQGWELGW